MIFSLSEEKNNLIIPKLELIDVICFFHIEKAIEVDSSLWWEIIRANLKIKHSVLILESDIQSFPTWDSSQRWQVGENWCWLTPRSLNVISSAYKNNPMKFQDFKNFLKNNK